MKTFSVIIPFFNNMEFIDKAIESILNSNYPIENIEIIIINDGSNDKNFQYLKKFNKIAKIYNKENGNWGSVINYVLDNRIAHNEYISILDADDFYDKEVFNFVNNCPNSDLIVGNYKKFDGKKIKKTQKTFYKSNKEINDKFKKISPHCLPLPYFIKKNVFYKCEKLLENIPYQDGVLNSQIINNSKSLYHCNKIFGYYYYNRLDNSMNMEWNKNRCENMIKTLNQYILYDNQEGTIYRLIINWKLWKYIKENKIIFSINRKFKFSYRWWINILSNILTFLIFRSIYSKKNFKEK